MPLGLFCIEYVQYVPCQEGEQGHLQSIADRAGLYVIDRLSISSGNTTPYFPASSTFPIYISWLWCTLFMYTTICLVAVCSCYHGLAINSLYSNYEPIICQLSLLLEPIFCVLVPDYINARTI